MQLQKSDNIIMPGDNIFAIRELRMKDNNYQVDKVLCLLNSGFYFVRIQVSLPSCWHTFAS